MSETTANEYTKNMIEDHLTEIKIETNEQFNILARLIDENYDNIMYLLNLVEDQNRVNKELFIMIAILACVVCCLIAYIIIRFGGI